jgi:hypothetical protein
MKVGVSRRLPTPTQRFPFSPTLCKAGLIQQYWRTRFQDYFQDKVSERTYQTIKDEIQQYDHVCLQLIRGSWLKLNFANFDNDVSACYDIIIVTLGMLAARQLGMLDNVIRTHATALKLMKYFVKTMYGISELNYKGTPFKPLFGTGQGPAVWLTLVVLLQNCLDTLITSCTTFQSLDGKQLHTRHTDAFVDDTSMGNTDDGNLSYEEMIKELEHIAQTREKLLHYSGGALNLKKQVPLVAEVLEWIGGRPTLQPRRESDPTTIQLSKGQKSDASSRHPLL